MNPSFLDYRVPVYSELSRLLHDRLTVVYSRARTPERVSRKLEAAIGGRALGLSGESVWRIGASSDFANHGLGVPWQRGLLETARRCRPDVVIGEGFFQWSPVALWMRVRHGTPLVISYERTAHTERACPWWRSAYRAWVVSHVDAMVCNGRLSAEYCESLGMERTRIITGGMAADSEFFRRSSHARTGDDVRASLGLKGRTLVYVGQMIPRKGVRLLLEAWKECPRASELGSLLLVGDGPELAGLKRFVKEGAVRGVVFAGGVDYAEIPRYLAAAHTLIMPTLEDNWSLVVPEAMALGLPIACSIYNGCHPELVLHDQNGRTFDPLNRASILDCLAHFLSLPSDELRRMGVRSQEIEGAFSPARAAQAVLEACQVAVARRGRSARRRGGPNPAPDPEAR